MTNPSIAVAQLGRMNSTQRGHFLIIYCGCIGVMFYFLKDFLTLTRVFSQSVVGRKEIASDDMHNNGEF